MANLKRRLETNVEGDFYVDSTFLLCRDTWLFSGDHLAWNPETGRLFAFRGACWYDWEVQRASMQRLSAYRFEWVLPGHGWRCHYPAEEMLEQLRACIDWMGRV